MTQNFVNRFFFVASLLFSLCLGIPGQAKAATSESETTGCEGFPKQYTVTKIAGDTYWDRSRQYYGTSRYWNAIMAETGIAPEKLKKGKVVTVPCLAEWKAAEARVDAHPERYARLFGPKKATTSTPAVQVVAVINETPKPADNPPATVPTPTTIVAEGPISLDEDTPTTKPRTTTENAEFDDIDQIISSIRGQIAVLQVRLIAMLEIESKRLVSQK